MEAVTTTPDASSEALLRERYGAGRSSRNRRTWIVAVGIVSVLALGWLGWTAWHHTATGIRGGLVAFTIDGERQTTARFQTRVSEGVEGTCLLRAMAVDHFVVGEVIARVDRSGTQSVPIRTERRASAVELVSCTPND
ncbi:hypothetical protein GCM10027425_18880 [Alteromonas gracilis]